MKTLTKERLVSMTPQEALDLLKEGNQRFLYNQKADRNLLEQVNQTSTGQFPFAVILGCIDSRVAPELVFDLGIGDVFSIRIAGNFVNEDILGSMEFACKAIGSKQILVLGHTSCGAVQGALDGVELGNLTQLVSKIKPAVDAAKSEFDQNSHPSVDQVAEINVNTTIDQILQRSPILKEMLDNQEIGISGAMYDVASGKVSFL